MRFHVAGVTGRMLKGEWGGVRDSGYRDGSASENIKTLKNIFYSIGRSI